MAPLPHPPGAIAAASERLILAIGQSDQAAFARALEEGACPSAKAKSGLSALELACRLRAPCAPEMVEALLSAGCDPRPLSAGGGPVWAAIRAGGERGERSLAALLRWGGDPNAMAEDGGGALEGAVFAYSPTAARFLLAAGADPCWKDRFGDQPIHLAAGVGAIDSTADEQREALMEIVLALAAAGADMGAQSGQGRTPAQIAVKKIALAGSPLNREQKERGVAWARWLESIQERFALERETADGKRAPGKASRSL